MYSEQVRVRSAICDDDDGDDDDGYALRALHLLTSTVVYFDVTCDERQTNAFFHSSGPTAARSCRCASVSASVNECECTSLAPVWKPTEREKKGLRRE